MAFSFFESSRARARPITLYLFQYGPSPTQRHGFTDAEQPVQIGQQTYLPVPIRHERIVANGSLDRNTMQVRVARNNTMAQMFRPYPPSYTVTLIVYRMDLNDPEGETQAVWNGRVLGCTLESDEAILAGEPISSQRRRPGLRRFYQYGCPHVLYKQGAGMCNANKGAATFPATVQSVDGFTVVMPTNWFDVALVPRFVGGLLEWTRSNGLAETRTILRVDNDRELVLGGPPVGLSPGSTVDVVYGCAHNMSDCQNVHNNLLNFGGCPFIPTDNPLGSQNNFY